MNRRAFLHLSPSAPLGAPAARRPLPVQAGLEPYAGPLDPRRAAHLLRRTGYGARPDHLGALLAPGVTAAAAADYLVEQAATLPLPPPPVWFNEAPPGRSATQEERRQYNQNNARWARELATEWVARLLNVGLRERMTLFWSNHFVTEITTYNLAVWAARYLTLLRTHALGNFRAFVEAIGKDPSMLIYLNGVQSRRGAPNENYARELLELFTMGKHGPTGQLNYTDSADQTGPTNDVYEIARALTGWLVNAETLTSYFQPSRFDTGQKTVFGMRGPFGYDDVVALIFSQRRDAVAHFVCRQLYREFVYDVPNEAVVAEMAAVFVDNDFEIAPVVRALLKSAHFFDEAVVGSRVKSPVELVLGLLNETGQPRFVGSYYTLLERYLVTLEQRLLSPPDVSGWPGHHTWLNTTTLPTRWLATEAMTYGGRGVPPLNGLPLAEALLRAHGHDPAAPVSVFYLPALLAEHLVPVAPELLDVVPVEEPFAGNLNDFPIPADVANGPRYRQDLAKILLAGVPWYEWSLDANVAGKLLPPFLNYLFQMPEYQLT